MFGEYILPSLNRNKIMRDCWKYLPRSKASLSYRKDGWALTPLQDISLGYISHFGSELESFEKIYRRLFNHSGEWNCFSLISVTYPRTIYAETDKKTLQPVRYLCL